METILDIVVFIIPFWGFGAFLFLALYMSIRRREKRQARMCEQIAQRWKERHGEAAIRSLFADEDREREKNAQLASEFQEQSAWWSARAKMWERGEL